PRAASPTAFPRGTSRASQIGADAGEGMRRRLRRPLRGRRATLIGRTAIERRPTAGHWTLRQPAWYRAAPAIRPRALPTRLAQLPGRVAYSVLTAPSMAR